MPRSQQNLLAPLSSLDAVSSRCCFPALAACNGIELDRRRVTALNHILPTAVCHMNLPINDYEDSQLNVVEKREAQGGAVAEPL